MKKSKRTKKKVILENKQHRDQFFKKSKILGYRSRASFKLIELNEKFKFIKNNSKLLDLGSSPGGWSQVASKIITQGKIIALDIKSMKPIKNVNFIKRDIFEEETKQIILNFFQGKLDIVISDMAADTTGNKFRLNKNKPIMFRGYRVFHKNTKTYGSICHKAVYG